MLSLGSAMAHVAKRGLLSTRLRRVLQCNASSARAVGACYLKQAGVRGDPELLSRRFLVEDLGIPAPIDSMTDAALREITRLRISADFACGNTIMVDGWILSRTEARLCAIVALS